MEEIWKQIDNTSGFYEVSNFGNVRSRKVYNNHNSQSSSIWHILKQSKNPYGYLGVGIKFDSGRKSIQVHNLVARAFIGPQDKNIWVRHKDEDITNNRLENLEYFNQRKFSTKEQQKNIANMYNGGETIESISKKLNSSMTSVHNSLIASKTQKRVPHWFHEKELNEDYFKEIDTEQKAYWLGLLYADGCLCRRINTYNVTLGLKESDRYLIDKFRIDIGSTHKISKHIKIPKNSDVGFTKKLYISYSLNISNKTFGENLIKHGITERKSLTCELPTTIKDESLWRHFFRGYWDGDGSIFTTGKSNITVISAAVSFNFGGSSLRLLNEKYGMNFKIRKSKSKIYLLDTAGKGALKFLNWIYSDANIYLNRKYDKFIYALNVQSTKELLSTSREKPVIQYDKNFNEISRFKSITTAAQNTSINRQIISDHLGGFNKFAGGFLFDYDTRYWIPKYRGKQSYGCTS